MAVEIVGLWAGDLPLGSHWLLDRVSEEAREQNIDVTWYRNAGRPVGLFRLYADQPRPATQVASLTLVDGVLTVAGRAVGEPQVVDLRVAGVGAAVPAGDGAPAAAHRPLVVQVV